MADRTPFDVTKLEPMWRKWWDGQCSGIIDQWNKGGHSPDDLANGLIYIESWSNLKKYFDRKEENLCQVIRKRRDGTPAAIIVRKPGVPPELWCHANYKNYRTAFAEFVRIEEGLDVRPSVPDMFDIDHAFFWKGVLAWGGQYVRVVVLPWNINSTWGWTYEATMLKARPKRKAVRRPMNWQTIAKTLCAPLPYPDQKYKEWLSALANWMATSALWPYDKVNENNDGQLSKIDKWVEDYHRVLFDRGLRWHELAVPETMRDEPDEVDAHDT